CHQHQIDSRQFIHLDEQLKPSNRDVLVWMITEVVEQIMARRRPGIFQRVERLLLEVFLQKRFRNRMRQHSGTYRRWTLTENLERSFSRTAISCRLEEQVSGTDDSF